MTRIPRSAPYSGLLASSQLNAGLLVRAELATLSSMRSDWHISFSRFSLQIDLGRHKAPELTWLYIPGDSLCRE